MNMMPIAMNVLLVYMIKVIATHVHVLTHDSQMTRDIRDYRPLTNYSCNLRGCVNLIRFLFESYMYVR